MERRTELINKLNECIEDGVKNEVFPGANYCLIIDGEDYYGSFGKKALYPKVEKNNLDTVYDIASLSKVVGTTSAILKLIEEGKLKLDDKINKYLEFIDNDIVTIRDLLTHSSGYPALTPDTTEMTKVEPLLNDLYNCKLEYETGTKVVYSDVGFMYLGFIVDKLTGSMSKYLDEKFFKPLDMVDTAYNYKNILRIAPTEEFKFRGMIRGFAHDEKAFLLDGVAGHAGIYSTVSDLGKFAKMLMNYGSYEGKEYLSSNSIKLIQEKHILNDDEDMYRSIGWIVKKVEGNEVIYHTGYTGTSILIDFKNKISFILLSNRVHPTRENTKIIRFRKEVEKLIYNNK